MNKKKEATLANLLRFKTNMIRKVNSIFIKFHLAVRKILPQTPRQYHRLHFKNYTKKPVGPQKCYLIPKIREKHSNEKLTRGKQLLLSPSQFILNYIPNSYFCVQHVSKTLMKAPVHFNATLTFHAMQVI